MSISGNLWDRFRNKKYRTAFAADQLKRMVPFQIRALRRKRGWSQEELAKNSGLTQGVISRAEDMGYGNLTFNTAIAIAAGFDLAFIGKFVPFSELEHEHKKLSEDSIQSTPTFEEEDRQRSLASGDDSAETQAGSAELIQNRDDFSEHTTVVRERIQDDSARNGNRIDIISDSDPRVVPR